MVSPLDCLKLEFSISNSIITDLSFTLAALPWFIAVYGDEDDSEGGPWGISSTAKLCRPFSPEHLRAKSSGNGWGICLKA